MMTLVFDWGNTLFKVFPGMNGPMKDWPKIEPMPGIREALEKITGSYRLVIASNSQDSNSDQVRDVLIRVGLDTYFDKVYTVAEIGYSKPEPQFFEKVTAMLSEEDDNLIMIGDDYQQDICAAVDSGWYAGWYTPQAKPCPGLLPFQQFEIISWEGLSEQLRNIELPSYQTAISWLVTNRANTSLLLHSQAVAAVSYLLGVWLRNKGLPVDAIVAHRGGLLHDIAKLNKRDPNDFEMDHAEIGSRILLEKNQPILAGIARSHLISSLYNDERCPRTWEQKIVHYADKIVEGSSVVMLEERIQAICKRYPHDIERILGSVAGVKQLQLEICNILELSPDGLKERINEALMSTTEE